jgi:hypothetical protein
MSTTFSGPVRSSAGFVGAAGIAVTAGGSTTPIITAGTAAGVDLTLGVYFGSGAPTISAAQGSLYLRTDGSSTSTRMYINTNGSTTWTAVTTAA